MGFDAKFEVDFAKEAESFKKLVEETYDGAFDKALEAVLSRPIKIDGKIIKAKTSEFSNAISEEFEKQFNGGKGFSPKKIKGIDVSKFINLDEKSLVKEIEDLRYRVGTVLEDHFDSRGKSGRRITSNFLDVDKKQITQNAMDLVAAYQVALAKGLSSIDNIKLTSRTVSDVMEDFVVNDKDIAEVKKQIALTEALGNGIVKVSKKAASTPGASIDSVINAITSHNEDLKTTITLTEKLSGIFSHWQMLNRLPATKEQAVFFDTKSGKSSSIVSGYEDYIPDTLLKRASSGYNYDSQIHSHGRYEGAAFSPEDISYALKQYQSGAGGENQFIYAMKEVAEINLSSLKDIDADSLGKQLTDSVNNWTAALNEKALEFKEFDPMFKNGIIEEVYQNYIEALTRVSYDGAYVGNVGFEDEKSPNRLIGSNRLKSLDLASKKAQISEYFANGGTITKDSLFGLFESLMNYDQLVEVLQAQGQQEQNGYVKVHGQNLQDIIITRSQDAASKIWDQFTFYVGNECQALVKYATDEVLNQILSSKGLSSSDIYKTYPIDDFERNLKSGIIGSIGVGEVSDAPEKSMVQSEEALVSSEREVNQSLEERLAILRDIQKVVEGIDILENSENPNMDALGALYNKLEEFQDKYSEINITEDMLGESKINTADFDKMMGLADYNFDPDSAVTSIKLVESAIQDVAQEAEVAKTSMEEIPKAISDASSANEDMVETTQNVVAAEENLRDVSENISDIKKQEVVDSSPTVDSVEESVPALQEESKALAELTQETKKATASKEEFAKANASTKDSAENSVPALNNEAEAMEKVNEASNQKAQKKSRAEKEADDYVKWWEKALKLRDIKEKSQIKSGAAYAERVDAERDAKEQARRDKAAADREKLEQRYNDVWSKAQKDRAAKEEAAAEKAQKAADKAAEAQASRQQSINDGANNSIENSLNYLNGINTSKYTSDFASTITSLKKELGDLSTKNLDYTIESNKDNLDEVLDKVENVKIALKQNKDSISLASYKQIESTYSKISSSGKYYDSLSGEGKAKYDELLSKAQSFRGASEVTKEELASLDEEIIRFNNDLKGMGVSAGYVENIMGGLSTTLKSLGARYLSLYRIVGYLRSAVTTVKDLDSALTELRKVADASTARLNQTLQTSTKTAKELGSTISDVINVTAD